MPASERIRHELGLLSEGGQVAEYIELTNRAVVLYRAVPTTGARLALPEVEDVIVPVPHGYAGAAIDLAGLRLTSPFLGRVRGGTNNQGRVIVEGAEWQLGSYHPHTNGGGPPWDPSRHGFHTYLDHLIAWLGNLS